MHVTTEGSTLSAIAESGRRSRANRPTSSPVRCCASAALPPFPNEMTRPPCSYASISRRAAFSTCGKSASSCATSAACSATSSAAANGNSGREPLEGDRCRPDDADAVPERRLNDAELPLGRLEHLRVHQRAHRLEQLLPRAAHAAADHDELRLEEVGERGDAAGERLARLLPDPQRDRVAGARTGRDIGGGHSLETCFVRALGDRRSRRVRLEAAAAAAAATFATVPVDCDVPELAAVARGAAIHAPVEDDPAPDARRHGQVDHGARAAARAEAVLRSRSRSRVVVEHRRAVERGRREVRDRDVLPAGEMKGRDEDTSLRVERTAAADSHRLDRDARILECAAPELEQAREPFARPTARLRGRDREAVHGPVYVDDAGGELRAADVEPEHRTARRDSRTVVREGGLGPCRRHAYPFRPWTAMPRMKYFWNAAKSTTIGSTSSSVPATIS